MNFEMLAGAYARHFAKGIVLRDTFPYSPKGDPLPTGDGKGEGAYLRQSGGYP
jgi:hypothetical protein